MERTDLTGKGRAARHSDGG